MGLLSVSAELVRADSEQERQRKKTMTEKLGKKKRSRRGTKRQMGAERERGRERKPNFDFLKLFNETSCMKKKEREKKAARTHQ